MLLIYNLQRAYIFRSKRKNTNVLINDKKKRSHYQTWDLKKREIRYFDVVFRKNII